jgi:hypothetical protein
MMVMVVKETSKQQASNDRILVGIKGDVVTFFPSTTTTTIIVTDFLFFSFSYYSLSSRGYGSSHRIGLMHIHTHMERVQLASIVAS